MNNSKEIFAQMNKRPNDNRVSEAERERVLGNIMDKYPEESVTKAMKLSAKDIEVPFITIYQLIQGRRIKKTEVIKKILKAYL